MAETASAMKGLTSGQAEQKLIQFGPNKIVGKRRASAFLMFLSQFKNVMVIILIAASVFAFFAGHGIDGMIILGIVVLNAIIGFVQEYRAEKAIEALQKLLAPRVRVVRDGREQMIAAELIVPGDVVILNEGDKVSADCELLQGSELRVDESILTGESVPVSKNSKKENKIFMGTQVAHGTGVALVMATGMRTEFGRIALLTTETQKDQSPLQKEIAHIGKFVGLITIAISFVLFLMGTLVQGRELIDTLLFAVSVAVAAVPEGLPAIITIALALGVQRLAQKNAIVKQLSSVETLGSTTIICSDKTGTLTKNEMTVREIILGRLDITLNGAGYEPKGTLQVNGIVANKKEYFEFGANDMGTVASDRVGFFQHLELAMQTAIICNNAKLVEDRFRWQILGDPTEGALLTMAEKAGFSIAGVFDQHEKVAEIPFDSERKRMSVFAREKKTGEVFVFVKGAPEQILEKCTDCFEDGKKVPLTSEKKQELMERNELMAGRALRTIALAYRGNIDLQDAEHLDADEHEKGLTLLGIVGMIDPPRDEVKAAVEVTHRAGIRIFIITGDYGPTALAIARELGIARRHNVNVVTGAELAEMNDQKLRQMVSQGGELIFARVNPADKLRIVDMLKQCGEVVAVTGDGVNDAPALKRADIGIAMGITGTDVSKEAANMVLTDDSFSSITSAVIEGRTIYENMKKFIFYIFSSNIGELIAIFLSIIFKMMPPLTAVLLLIINTLTDVFPALALGVEPVEKRVIDLPPRDPKARIMSKPFVIRYMLNGIWIGCVTFGVFVWNLRQNGWSFGDVIDLDSVLYLQATTMAFVVLTLLQMVHALNSRSPRESVFRMNLFQNLYLLGAIALSTALTVLFVQMPFFNTYLKTQPLGANAWLIIGVAAFSVLGFEEIRKFIGRNLLSSKQTATTHESPR